MAFPQTPSGTFTQLHFADKQLFPDGNKTYPSGQPLHNPYVTFPQVVLGNVPGVRLYLAQSLTTLAEGTTYGQE